MAGIGKSPSAIDISALIRESMLPLAGPTKPNPVREWRDGFTRLLNMFPKAVRGNGRSFSGVVNIIKV